MNTALYRTVVAEAFPEALILDYGDRRTTYRKLVFAGPEGSVGLRYGENPHQEAAAYCAEGYDPAVTWIKLGKGAPSWTNLADVDAAMRLLRYLDRPACAVMKHLNPSGVAQARDGEPLAEVHAAARDCDPRAAFGGVVVLNRPVDGATARSIASGFVEVVAAPAFGDEALQVLGAKADLRLATIPDPSTLPRWTTDPEDRLELRSTLDGGLLVQRPFRTRVRASDDLTPIGTRPPTAREAEDLLFAWYVTTGVRSNAVVLARHGRTLAVGTGEQERVGAVEQAIAKARAKGHDLQGAVCASDGFFPFPDAVEALAEAGVTAVVHPGGSVRDAQVAEAADARGVALLTTGERCFGHF